MDILIPDIPVLEKVVRSVVVYVFLLVAFRVAGKRQLGQLTAFDLVVLLIISNVVQNALIGKDDSLGGGLVGATVILILNWLVAWITFRIPRAGRLIDPSPTVLVRHGRLEREALRREQISRREFRASLRREGAVSLRDVRYAVLEETGHVSVIKRERGERPGSGGA
jgi:uncharacterized membrane protein YcaP (DUF421 family)